MNWYFASAAFVLFATALVHSVVGERLIFRRLRGPGWIPTEGGQVLPEAHVRILWENWHLVSALGGGFAVVLVWLALPSTAPATASFVAPVLAVSTLAGSMLVLVGTKGRHPGWISLLLAALLTAVGIFA